MHALRLRALEGRSVSSKSLQGSETEARELLGLGGTTENSVSPTRGHSFALQGRFALFVTNCFAIVQNVERLFDLVGGGDGGWGVDHGTTKTTSSSDKAMKQSFQKQDKTVTSFR